MRRTDYSLVVLNIIASYAKDNSSSNFNKLNAVWLAAAKEVNDTANALLDNAVANQHEWLSMYLNGTKSLAD